MNTPIIEMVSSIPEPARASKANGGGSVYSNIMRDMPTPATVTVGKGKDAKTSTNIASFFVQANADTSTITDPKEKEKAIKDSVRKLANQFTSIARRLKKTLPNSNFAFRSATDANGVAGLRVYREADSPSTDPAS